MWQNWREASSPARLRWMRATLAADAKDSVGAELEAKASFSAFWSETGGSTREWSRVFLPRSLWRLYARRQGRAPSTLRINSEVTILSSAGASITRLIIPKTWSTREPKITLTALRDFGVLRSISCTITEEFPNITFPCILRRWSTDLIIARTIYSNCLSTSILVTNTTNYLILWILLPY